MATRFGPGGNSDSFKAEGHKTTLDAPAFTAGRGLALYEYECGNGVTGSEETFRAFGKEAARCGVTLSLHAPYFISLSGADPVKRLGSLRYIEQSQNAAEAMGADLIVIHTGSAAQITREEAMRLTEDTLRTALESLPDLGVKWGLETMGKRNQLGTRDEILQLCAIDKRLCPVVDFGHVNAREGGHMFDTEDDVRRYLEPFGDYLSEMHCHFSRIQYTAAGEKKHLTFATDEAGFGPTYEPLLNVLARDSLDLRIICESDGTQIEDAAEMQKYYLEQMEK